MTSPMSLTHPLSGQTAATAQGARLRRHGENLLRKGRLQDAIDKFAAALEALPGDLPTLFHLATTAERLGMADGAIRFYEQILDRSPDQLEVLINLSHAYREAGRAGKAIDLLQGSLARLGDDASLWHALGSARRETGDRDSARSCFTTALRHDPLHGAASGSLADLDMEEGRTEEALSRYGIAERNTPRDTKMGAQVRLSHALALLQTGDLAAGWAAYGARFKAQGAREGTAADRRLKSWTGQPLKGRPLRILAEQGLGDQLMFAATLPSVLSGAALDAGPITLTCAPRLARLLARSCPDLTVVPTDPDADAPMADQPQAYWRISLGNLPGLLWPERVRSLAADPFLRVDEAEGERWRGWLGTLGPGPRIGLCWRSGRQHGLRADSYAPLTEWIALARKLSATLICVQYDVREDELAAFRDAGVDLHVPPGLDQKQDIDRATALLSRLDQVVTAPTTVAYQAALAGTPTIRLLPFAWWTHLGTGRDAFAPALTDLVAEHPAAWDTVMGEAATLCHPTAEQEHGCGAPRLTDF